MQVILQPDLRGRGECAGLVERRGGHVDADRTLGDLVGQRTAACAAKLAHHAGRGLEYRGLARGDLEALPIEGQPGDRGRAAGSAAARAMTYDGRRGLAGDAIAHRTAETASRMAQTHREDLGPLPRISP